MPKSTPTDNTALERLGQRLARYRLNRNLTQDALATEAGISLATLQRMEAGHSAQTSNLVRVLRALNLMENLDALVPESPESPLQQVKLQGRKRKRASSSTQRESRSPWTWGDAE